MEFGLHNFQVDLTSQGTKERERQQLLCNFKYFVGLIMSNTFCYFGLSEDFLLFSATQH